MRKSIVLCCLVTISVLTLQPAAEASSSTHYMVHTHDGVVQELFSAELAGGTITGMDKFGELVTISHKDINALYQYDGSKAGRYGVYGGLVGFGIALVAGMSAQSDGEVIDSGKVLPVFLLCTGGGALAGAIIGGSEKQWKNVPIQSMFGLSADGRTIQFCLGLSF